MSQLLFGVLKKNSSFLVKRNGQTFSRDPFSSSGLFRQSYGGVYQQNAVGVNISVVEKAKDKKKNLVANLRFIKNGVLPRKCKKNANTTNTLNVARLHAASKVIKKRFAGKGAGMKYQALKKLATLYSATSKKVQAAAAAAKAQKKK